MLHENTYPFHFVAYKHYNNVWEVLVAVSVIYQLWALLF